MLDILMSGLPLFHKQFTVFFIKKSIAFFINNEALFFINNLLLLYKQFIALFINNLLHLLEILEFKHCTLYSYNMKYEMM